MHDEHEWLIYVLTYYKQCQRSGKLNSIIKINPHHRLIKLITGAKKIYKSKLNSNNSKTK